LSSLTNEKSAAGLSKHVLSPLISTKQKPHDLGQASRTILPFFHSLQNLLARLENGGFLLIQEHVVFFLMTVQLPLDPLLT
jgi:hypothetical protein